METNPTSVVGRGASWLRGADHRLFLLVAACAIVFRVICLSVIFRGDPLGSSGDAVQYHYFGLSIAQDPDWFSKHLGVVPPGYPVFLAIVYKIFGDAPLTALYVQSLLAGLNSGLMLLIGRRTFGLTVGLLGAALYTFNPTAIKFGCMLIREDLIISSYLATIWATLALAPAFTWRRVAFLGLCYTILIHVDPRFLIYAPFLGLYALMGPAWRRLNWGSALVLTGTVVLLTVPWTIRNYVTYDRIELIDTRTLGFVQLKQIGEFRYEKPPREVDELAIAHGQAAPDTSAAKAGVRAYDGTNASKGDSRLARALRGAPANLLEFWRVFQFRESYLPLLDKRTKPWSRAHNLGSIVFYGPLFILGFIGITVAWRRGRRATLILSAPIVLHSFLHMTQFVNQRYRLPIEMNLSLFAMFAFVWVFARLRQHREGGSLGPS